MTSRIRIPAVLPLICGCALWALPACRPDRVVAPPVAPSPSPVAERATQPAAEQSRLLLPTLDDPSESAQSFARPAGFFSPTFRTTARVITHTTETTLPPVAQWPSHVIDSASGVAADLALTGVTAVSGSARNGLVTYPAAFHGGDVIERPVPDGLGVFVGVEGPPPSGAVTWDLGLGATVGGVAEANGIEIQDFEGVTRLRLVAPVIIDAAGGRHPATATAAGCPELGDASSASCQIRVQWSPDAVTYPATIAISWQSAGPARVLVIPEAISVAPSALENALRDEGMEVSVAGVSRADYDGTHPALDAFDVVVLAGGSADGLGLEAQRALLAYVKAGGGLVLGAWAPAADLGEMDDLALLRSTGANGEAGVLSRVSGQQGNGIVASLPDPLHLQATLIQAETSRFDQNPVTVVLRDDSGHDVAAVRRLGLGRAAEVSLTAGEAAVVVEGHEVDANLLRLLVDAASWTSGSRPKTEATRRHYAAGSACVNDNGCRSRAGTYPYCVNNVCCSAMACDPCAKCGAANSANPGNCVADALGTTPASSCGDYLCDGTDQTCPTSCTSNADCITNYTCIGNTCQLEPNGGACTANTQCKSGNCISETCCASTTGCGAYTCNATGCNTTCTTDAQCTTGYNCILTTGTTGTCGHRVPNGSACSYNDQCTSLLCVDSVCCNDACTCGSCTNGTCAPYAAGSADCGTGYLCEGGALCPTTCTVDTECQTGYFCNTTTDTCQAAQADGVACTNGDTRQCSSSFCVTGVCCNSDCGVCGVCDAANGGTCSSSPAGTTCNGYLCVAGTPTCPTTCASDAACAGGFFCNPTTNTCQAQLANGKACFNDDGRDCTSGDCVNNVCCNSACACGTCTTGTCAAVSAGSENCGVGYVCEGATTCPTTCAGDVDCQTGYFCNPNTKVCQAQEANGATCYAADNRDCASGECLNGICCNDTCTCGSCTTGTCAPAAAGSKNCGTGFLCEGGDTCPATCSADNECQTGYFCNPNTNLCQTKGANGTTCFNSDGADCTSGNCVGGVCCNDACGCGTCASGTCAPYSSGTHSCGTGFECEGTDLCPTTCTSDSQCATGDFCNPTTKACQAQGSNGATCYNGDALDCTSGNCVNGICCNDACSCGSCTTGTCAPDAAGTQACGSGYECSGADTCPATCSSDAQCATAYFCNPTTSTCQAKEMNGATCFNGDGRDCTSGNCIDGVCCNSACGGCGVCSAANKGVCTADASGNAGSPSCAPYLCDGTDVTCPATCTADSQCASPDYCNTATHQCSAPQANGNTCTETAQCGSGNCVSGVCCNSTCGACGTCSVANKGVCTPDPVSSAGSPSCAPLVCDGTDITCPQTCAADSQCVSPQYCNPTSHTCSMPQGNGNTCTETAQCSSGDCVGGICCNTTCGSCGTCTAATHGLCNPLAQGSPTASCAPYLCDGTDATCPTSCTADSECAAPDFCNTATGQCSPPKGNGSTCTEGAQCSSSNCVDGICCNTACGTCGACTAANSGVCTPLGGGTDACGAYVCDGTDVTCPSTCTSDTSCASGDYCKGSQCAAKGTAGSSCTATDQCATGQCADGVCCNTACSGTCDVCSSAHGAATNGTCQPGAAGFGGQSPGCGAYVCGGTSDSCPTSCQSDSNCATGDYCGNGTCTSRLTGGVTCSTADQCLSGSCADGVCCNAACSGSCDVCTKAHGSPANGQCSVAAAGFPGLTPGCSPYVCDGADTTCPQTCTTNAQCATGLFCSAGQCIPPQGPGFPCTSTSECSSGFCTGGVCCNQACTDGCDACSVAQGASANGTCTVLAPGAAGVPGCGTYLCDGQDPTCPGSCQSDAACATGDYCSNGACVSQAQAGASCTAADQCSTGFCTGSVCCTTSCSDGCDSCAAGSGQCKALSQGSTGVPGCGAYVCDGTDTTCPSSCTSDGQCGAGDYCSNGSCVARSAQGAACGAADQCLTGFCSDGVCCNSACADGCDACAQSLGASKDGICTTLPAGNGGENPSCNPFVCDGTDVTCPTKCTTDSGCAAGDYCAAGDCIARQTAATVCSTADQCASGFCVDGVCCNSACTGECAACNLPASPGTCSPATGAPVGMRAPCATDGSSCAGTCDGTHTATCSFPTAATTCGSGMCSNGEGMPAPVCNGQGTCVAGAGSACSPYQCMPGGTGCLTQCASNTDCQAGDICTGSQCVPMLGNGATCSGAEQCESGLCVDGVCCNATCTDQCAACDLPSSLGTCSPVSGAPVGGRTACSTDGSSCGGACDGTNPAACAYAGPATTCGSGACMQGSGIPAPVCDGQGDCVKGTGSACAPYQCSSSGAGCLTQCASGADCQGGAACVGGQCIVLLAPGAACTAATQCESGFCADGVCCNVACTDECVACDLPSSAGTCTPVMGAPVGGRAACASDGSSCGGTCNGTSNACAYATASTTCGQGTCTGGTGTPAPVCDGQGDCVAGMGSACAPYQCAPNGGCLTQCAASTDCQAGDICVAGQCSPILMPGSPCATAEQCASGFCADGVCCSTSCTDQCGSCDLPGTAGTCAAVSGAPVDGRSACSTDGSVCGGSCDGAHTTACAYPPGSTTCGSGTCANGNGTPAPVCSGAGSCVPGTGDACAPYQCTPMGGGCLTQCATSGDCQSGAACVAGSCVLLQPNSATCTQAGECASGFCADGVCCNTACTDQCVSCDLPGSAGTCSPVTGNPVGGRTQCAAEGTACGGTCSGTSTTACTYPTSATACGAAMCASGTLMSASSCNGSGACSAASSTTCAPYQCAPSGTACLAQCATNADCQMGAVCAADGTCQGSVGPGQSCTSDAVCASGTCSGGVCCSTPCNGACSTCSATGSPGTCTPLAAGTAPAKGECAPLLCDGVDMTCPTTCSANTDCATGFVCSGGSCVIPIPNGATCSAASACESGFCVDGVCCNSACDGSCDSCDQPATAGTCTQVTGAPEAGKTCMGAGTCAGTCDGTNDDCTYPGTVVQCAPAFCSDAVAVSAGLCDGNGTCGKGTTADCLEGCAGDHCAPLPAAVKAGCASTGVAEPGWTMGLLALVWLSIRRRSARVRAG